MSACLCVLLPRAAAAEPTGVTLNWVRLAGAEGCVSATDLMNRVEQRARKVLFVRSGDALLSVDGYVRAVDEPKGWAVKLAVSQADGRVLGSRDLGVLTGADCHVIDESVEFLVHVTLDPNHAFDMGILSPQARAILDAALRGDPPNWDPKSLLAGMSTSTSPTAYDLPAPQAPSATPKAATQAAPKPTSDTATDTQPGPSPAVLDVSGTAGLGRIPGVSFGLALHVALFTRIGWIVELGVEVWPTRTVDAGGTSNGSADVDSQLGSLAVCPLNVLHALALCAGARYGRMGVTASGFKTPAPPSSATLFDLFGSAVLHVQVAGPLSVRGALVLAVPLVRNEFVFDTRDGTQRLFRTFPIVSQVELGLGLRL
jgi:hypothetical protein